MPLDYSQKRTVEPASRPITLQSVKDHLRVSDNDDDGQIIDYIDVAIERLETDTRRALVTQTWERKYDCWPCFPLALDRPPLQSVSSIQYVDTAGATQTLATSNYTVDTARDPGVIHLTSSATLPTLDDEPNVVTIEWVAGYGTESNVPARAKHAIRLLLSSIYDGCELEAAYNQIASQLSWGFYP